MKSREFWDRILDHARALVGVDRIVILIDTGASMRAIASEGFVNPIHEILAFHARDPLFTTAVTEHRAVQSEDVLDDPAIPLSPVGRAYVESEGYRAAMAVPLLADSKVLGALVMCRSRAGAFSIGDIETAETFADLAARAVEHDRVGDIEVARARAGTRRSSRSSARCSRSSAPSGCSR